MTDAPILESLTRRLAETPDEFLDPAINVTAIVGDTLRAMGVAIPQPFPAIKDQSHLTLIALTCWLLHEDWFLRHPDLAPRVQPLFTSLKPLSEIVQPREFITDPDRREELARFTLHALSLRPQGETEAQ